MDAYRYIMNSRFTTIITQTQTEVILQALASREEERVSKTRLALLALCQTEAAAFSATRAEEAARAGVVDAIDVEGDLRAFVAEHLFSSSSSSSSSASETTMGPVPVAIGGVMADAPAPTPSPAPTAMGVLEEPPTVAVVVVRELGQTQHGAALAEKLDLLAKGGPHAVAALTAPPPPPQQQQQAAPASGAAFKTGELGATTSSSSSQPVSPLSPPSPLAEAATANTVGSLTMTTSASSSVSLLGASKRSEYYSCRYPQQQQQQAPTTATSGGDASAGASTNDIGVQGRHSVNLSMGSIDLGFESEAEEEEEGGVEGEGEVAMVLRTEGSERLRSGEQPQEQQQKGNGRKKRPVGFGAPSMSRELSVSSG
jgi:hypothetical protein